MTKTTEPSSQEEKIKALLAEQLGVSVEDIGNEDSLENDLRISASALAEFIHTLESQGFDISKIDLKNVETFGDIIEAIDPQ